MVEVEEEGCEGKPNAGVDVGALVLAVGLKPKPGAAEVDGADGWGVEDGLKPKPAPPVVEGVLD